MVAKLDSQTDLKQVIDKLNMEIEMLKAQVRKNLRSLFNIYNKYRKASHLDENTKHNQIILKHYSAVLL